MTFRISVTIDRTAYIMTVERIHATSQIERYKVSAGGRSVVFQTNGPLFKRKGLKHRKPDWKLIEGKAWNTYAVKEVAETIQAYLDRERG